VVQGGAPRLQCPGRPQRAGPLEKRPGVAATGPAAQGDDMILTTSRSRIFAGLLVLVLAAPCPTAAQQAGAAAQPAGSAGATSAVLTPEQLEQVVAPVALYPDPLLAQVLMASTYPLEIAQAARFVGDHKDLKGDQLDEALKDQNWDDSVKSLVDFPEVLALMDGKLDWTQKLGDAFLAQQKDVLDAVQRLRKRAQAEGSLKSTKEQTVAAEPAEAGQPEAITIEPANPEIVYVPSYNPAVVYGTWPYPAYPPYSPYPPGYAFSGALIFFGLGLAVGGALWGDCNWGRGDVDVRVEHYRNYSRNVNRSNVATERISRYQPGQAGDRSQWRHSPEHRQGVQYRDQATQQRFSKAANPQAVQSREAFRGYTEQGGRSASGGAGQGLGGGREAGAFQGMGSGADTRSFSNRGQASRQSMGAGGGFSGTTRPAPTAGGGGRAGGGARGGGRR
jgi:hypothetical protein